MASHSALALVTAPSLEEGERLARLVVESRLAACVNLIPGVTSVYRWEGKLEKSQEVLLIVKTARSKIAELERALLAAHPYDTAEFVVIEPEHLNARYEAWIDSSTAPPASAE